MIAFRELDYLPVLLSNLAPEGRLVFWRHDVDLCLSRAARLAEVEQEHGVFATYYVLVSTDMYSVAAAESVRMLRGMIAAGHEIGLHFDAKRHAGNLDALQTAAAWECDRLADITGSAVKSMSFHRPVAELLGFEGDFAERCHTYQPRYFSDVAYVSDSSGGWFRGHPLDHDAICNGQPLQLLTHPEWWVTDDPRSPTDILNTIGEERRTLLSMALDAATANAKKLAAANDANQ